MEAPTEFSWVVPSKLAAMGWPKTSANIKFLYSEGVRHIVTLSPEMHPPLQDPHFTNNKISWTEIAVEEFEPPTTQQIQQFISVCEMANSRQESVGVHCRMGLGRTGVMAASYLVKFQNQAPETAISNIRLIRPYSVETREQERSVKYYYECIWSKEMYKEKPWNFSWVVPSKLAAMGWPKTSANIKFLYSEGIRHLVTLSSEMRPPLQDPHFTNNQITWTEIAVEEFEPPTIQQIQQFINVCELANSRQERVGVHCRMGLGRTGVMAASYLVKFQNQSSETAINNIRLMRPYSIETKEQELAVKYYHECIWPEETYMTAPWNFSWVVSSKLAAMSWPETSANIKFLYSEGIRHVVTLSSEMRPPLQDPHFTNNKISWTEIAVKEFEPPTIQQIQQFIRVCELANSRQERVGVHCRLGLGRTGVMAASYLVKFQNQIPETAISNVRLMRPYSIGTREQEHAVKYYHEYIRSEETYMTAPWNFSWVVSSKLAAMSWPETSANIKFLYSEGIRHLVTLSPEMRPPLQDPHFINNKISWTEIAVEEFEPPTFQQIQQFISVCELANSRQESVGVHCRMGLGRTGVMAASYLVKFQNQAPETAINNIRFMRPYSIETREQERAVKYYHECIRCNHSN